jgi:hypothetical protein
MTRFRFLLLATCAAVVVSACSKSETPAPATPAAAAKPAAPEAKVLKVPVLPGYKYYVGGPELSRDPYGRFRISGFNGEVQQPPSRGMVFGAKREGNQLEYRVWGNGTPLGYHKGIMRDGVYWEEYGEGYRMGKIVARERQTHDDAAKRSKVITEDLDPETGELIRTKETEISYEPPALDDEFFADTDEDEDEDEDAAPKQAPAGIVAPGSAATSNAAKDAAKDAAK